MPLALICARRSPHGGSLYDMIKRKSAYFREKASCLLSFAPYQSTTMFPTLEYNNQGRGGSVIYKDEQGDINLSFEFGGGNCVAIIFVPTPEQWTRATSRPSSERESILTFVAERAVRDQTSGGHYTISDSWIEIYSRRG